MDLHRRQVFLKTMTESDVATTAETDRSDTGLWPQFLFIVTVPTHRVFPVSVPIPQDRVEGQIRSMTNQLLAYLLQSRGPWTRFQFRS